MMRGIEALEYFLESWNSKINSYDEFDVLDAMVEYALGSDVRIATTKVVIEKYFDKKIKFKDRVFEDLKTSFLPEEVEFDPETGNLYIPRSLYKIKIAPKVC
jgi:hypothetical protein